MKKLTAALLACGVFGFMATPALAQQAEGERYKPSNELIQPIEPHVVENQAEVDLGKKLWFDPRLSRSGFISCNSCHNLMLGGADHLVSSVGDYWAQGPINSPTVLNSSLNFVQFWDGRAADLREQAGGPIANPLEMGSTHELAVSVLKTIPGYVDEFEAVYGDREITIEEVTGALAAFEETLVTPNARFDQWLKGDDDAITDQELNGYLLFKNSGCVACHNGPNLGGNSFQRMGLVEPYVTDNETAGRAGVTGQDIDRMNFKVPTLRNVELTYPYFHDGGAKTLSEAVDIMGRLQLGKKFEANEIEDIVAFLKTLTGDQPEFTIPVLYPNSDETPLANPWAPQESAEG
ncbi:Cytochrome c551 peroxidase precursor [Oligella ureolytica]|uniref:Cytochrome c551 peroxidase n=1 Tax=Oligella ureolytica TaxID=90244 RepID=A0A378XCW8_9BURK|nr:cytochrome-c peroxidase [Oligella ureolytica]QPT40697.1 cytochrome-c peroxidase [Oligella ureolytica]SUA52479.1 Cytochrome c551 peroxidase precursor [Oligella ureolytica]